MPTPRGEGLTKVHTLTHSFSPTGFADILRRFFLIRVRITQGDTESVGPGFSSIIYGRQTLQAHRELVVLSLTM